MIKFQKPLTLILGHNGAGKTTIIECLKAITMSLLIGISMIKFVPKTFTRRQESNPGFENVF